MRMLPRKYRDANFVRHEPCEVCGSRDNKAVYDDGSSYCFSCKNSVNREVWRQALNRRVNL